MTNEKFFIIDAMAMVYRNFFAFSHTRLWTAKGFPTSALFGSARFLTKLLLEEKPDYIVAVWDSDAPTFRHEKYDAYKSHRDAMPSDLTQQMPLFPTLFAKLHIVNLKVPGYESDDIIASLCAKVRRPQVHTYIVSSDKDFLQLVNDHVSLYIPRKGVPATILGPREVRKTYLCEPQQTVDMLALMGDASDHVPGVPGIGEKTAMKLIHEYGSLEEVYEKIDELPAKQRQNLSLHRHEAFLSRDLVRLEKDLPVEANIDSYRIVPLAAVAQPDLIAFYQELEFAQLIDHISESLDMQKPAPVPQHARVASGKVTTVRSAADLEALVAMLVAAPSFAFDVEAEDLDPITAAPRGICFALADGAGYWVPLGGDEGLEPSHLQCLRPVFADSEKRKIAHNLKFKIQVLANADIPFALPAVDTMICDYLLEPTYQQHGFESCIFRHLDFKKKSYAVGEKARLILSLYDKLYPEILKQNLERVLIEVEMPLVPVLAQMEREGVFVDAKLLDDFSETLALQIKKTENAVFKEAGREFNINSTKQLQKILFEELEVQHEVGIKRLKKTKTGYSTDESVLQQLVAHPLPRLILEYRRLFKIKGTYVDALPQLIHPQTNRVHTRLQQTVTATGRLSSVQPNLQNIPHRSELGNEVRKAFRAQSKDSCLISADYSQIEIRLLALFAGVPALQEAFRAGRDIHQSTAARIFAVPLDQVTKEQRHQAKAINFGIIYGMGPTRLAATTGITVAEARAFIQRYFAVYPEIRQYTQGLVRSARESGYSVTFMGRRRPIPELRDRSRVMLARGENIAINAPIQGGAADVIKLAMIQITRAFRTDRMRTRMVLQIHDELLFESPRSEVETACAIIKREMETIPGLDVHLLVNIGVGESWFAVDH